MPATGQVADPMGERAINPKTELQAGPSGFQTIGKRSGQANIESTTRRSVKQERSLSPAGSSKDDNKGKN